MKSEAPAELRDDAVFGEEVGDRALSETDHPDLVTL